MVNFKKAVPALLVFAAPFATAENGLFQQDKLTGDWAGYRSQLNSAGVYMDGEYTNFYQSAVSGVEGKPSNTSHRFDFKAGLDTGKLGLWQGGSIHTQIAFRDGYANDLGFDSVALANTGHYGYEQGENAFIPSLYYVHRFSATTSAMAGKIDAIELLRHAPFYGGAARHGFMNIGFSAPPSGVTPPAFLGAMVNHQVGSTRFTGMVFDPRDRYTDRLAFDEAFDDGVNVSVSVTHAMKVAGRHSTISGSYTHSTEEGADWRSLDIANSETLFSEVAKSKYNARIQLTHNLSENPQNPREAWGVYLRAALADGNPNLLEGSFTGGLGGQALFFERPQDSWGIGYYRLNLSNDLQNAINETVEGAGLPHRMQDEQGVEAYYAWQAAPWLTFTADVQYMQTLLSTQDNALLLGFRTNIRF